MSLIKTKNGSVIEAILLEQTPSGRIWFAADCIIATNNKDEEISATYSLVDASVIMNNLRYEIIMARKWYSIYLVTDSEERVFICKAFYGRSRDSTPPELPELPAPLETGVLLALPEGSMLPSMGLTP